MSKMQIREALNVISDGHTIWKVSYAKRVCEALGVPFDEKLVKTFHSENDIMGNHMLPGYEGSKAVYSLDLSEYVALRLGVKNQAESKIGRGSQAREYARVVELELGRQDKI